MDSIVKTMNTRAVESEQQAAKKRDACATREEANRVCMKSYNQGANMAYTDAGNKVYRALAELRNKLQNGCLTKADFDQAMGLL